MVRFITILGEGTTNLPREIALEKNDPQAPQLFFTFFLFHCPWLQRFVYFKLYLIFIAIDAIYSQVMQFSSQIKMFILHNLIQESPSLMKVCINSQIIEDEGGN